MTHSKFVVTRGLPISTLIYFALRAFNGLKTGDYGVLFNSYMTDLSFMLLFCLIWSSGVWFFKYRK